MAPQCVCWCSQNFGSRAIIGAVDGWGPAPEASAELYISGKGANEAHNTNEERHGQGQTMKQRALQNNTIPNSLTAPRTLRLGTWCSGLKSIAIALIGLGISYCQVFAADINKAAQACPMQQ